MYYSLVCACVCMCISLVPRLFQSGEPGDEASMCMCIYIVSKEVLGYCIELSCWFYLGVAPAMLPSCL